MLPQRARHCPVFAVSGFASVRVPKKRSQVTFCLRQVSATSRGDYSSVAQSLGVRFFPDANDLCEEHPDVVILASSILSTRGVLKKLPVQRLKRSTLFVDVLSVKVFPKQLMLADLPREVRWPH